MRTRICEMLGIQYAIIQGGMLWLATAELASAVSNAGALGVISPLAGMDRAGEPADNLRIQLSKIRKRTSRPFGVNIPLDLPYAGLLMGVLLEENAGIVITAAGNPGRFTEVLKEKGVKVLHVVSNVFQAEKAENAGVDMVIAEGVEAAAHNGPDELPLFSLLPQVVDVVSIPVIAAGGIVDGRGMAAARCLGAEGVQLGTRFVAVEENIAHPNYKEAIINARDTDTVISNRRLIPTRSLKTPFTKDLIGLERSGASAEEIIAHLGYRRNRLSQIEGDMASGEAYCGASAGLIKEILPAGEVVRRLVRGYEKTLGSLGHSEMGSK